MIDLAALQMVLGVLTRWLERRERERSPTWSRKTGCAYRKLDLASRKAIQSCRDPEHSGARAIPPRPDCAIGDSVVIANVCLFA